MIHPAKLFFSPDFPESAAVGTEKNGNGRACAGHRRPCPDVAARCAASAAAGRVRRSPARCPDPPAVPECTQACPEARLWDLSFEHHAHAVQFAAQRRREFRHGAAHRHDLRKRGAHGADDVLGHRSIVRCVTRICPRTIS